MVAKRTDFEAAATLPCCAPLHKCPRSAFRDKESTGKVRFDLSACALNCDVFNMSAFADMADSLERLAEGTGRRVEKTARIVVGKNKKKHAIVRVCQLRIIGWLKAFSPCAFCELFQRAANQGGFLF
jgi:hypothetical protein